MLLIDMMKSSTSLVSYLLNEQSEEHWMMIFEFLNKNPISETALSIFGDIFIYFARNCPDKVFIVVFSSC